MFRSKDATSNLNPRNSSVLTLSNHDEPIEKQLKSTRSYSEDGANEIEVLGSVPSSGSTLKFIGSILGVKTTFFLWSAI